MHRCCLERNSRTFLEGSKNRNTVTLKSWNWCREPENTCFPYEFPSQRGIFCYLGYYLGQGKFFPAYAWLQMPQTISSGWLMQWWHLHHKQVEKTREPQQEKYSNYSRYRQEDLTLSLDSITSLSPWIISPNLQAFSFLPQEIRVFSPWKAAIPGRNS